MSILHQFFNAPEFTMKFIKTLLASTCLLGALSAHAATNLVVNGSFEANAQPNGTWNIYSNLVGWTGAPNIELRNNVAGVAQDGLNFVELDTYNNSTMSQTIFGTGLVNFSFWYSARPGVAAGSNDIGFSLAGLSGTVLQAVAGGPAHNWQQYSAVVDLGNSGSALLSFSALGTSNSLGGSIDNVSITAVPEAETYAMLLAGLGLVGAIARRRQRA
jgi:hypothetical protein